MAHLGVFVYRIRCGHEVNEPLLVSHRSRNIRLARGILDFKLGLILSTSMFVGGILGATFALKMNAAWLRRVFIVTVFALAARMLMWRLARSNLKTVTGLVLFYLKA